MKRWAIAAAVVLAVALLATVAAVATAGGGEKRAIPTRTVLTFLDITAREDFLDLPPRAQGDEDVSLGDAFFFQDQLWNLARTQRRGTLWGGCEVRILPTAHCRATAFIAGGTIEFAQTLNFARIGNTFRLAVVGGTGRYKNVTGQATVTELGQEGDRSRVTVELIPASGRGAGAGLAGRS